MAGPDQRFAAVIAAIDAANACDSRTTEVNGRLRPAELVYGERMTATLDRVVADPSESLRIAVRGQHIERRKIPRADYPQGRAGYLRWRRDQRDYQARRLGEIMTAAGYDAHAIERVGVLIRKEKMKTDPEVQLFEDIICMMFLEHYLPGFMKRVDEIKLSEILAKTWTRMSPFGHEHALKMALPPAVPALIERGLARMRSAQGLPEN